MAGERARGVSGDPRVTELHVGGQRYLVVSRPLPERPAGLTAAEWQVARLVAEGASNGVVAATRRTSVKTVANQVASILAKLGMTSRRQLAGSLGLPEKETT